MNFLELAAEAFKRGWPKRDKGQDRGQVDYHTYIHSQDWEDRKRRYWATHEKQCVICFTRRHIDLHHLTYFDLGNEEDDHLVAVCRKHHEQFHQRYGSAKDMRRQWAEFLRYTVPQWRV